MNSGIKVFLLFVLNTITPITVSMVSAKLNIKKGMTIKFTVEKINPPIDANAKKTNVPVTHIAIAFRFVSVVTNRINKYLIKSAMIVKYQ